MPGLDALTAGVGQTDQRDARHAIGGLLAVQGPTPLDIRTGVLAGPGSTQLITGTSRTGPTMSVLIGSHVAVTSRGVANGPYLGPTLEAPVEVDVELAPASGSRIDVVYVKQRDTTSGVPSPDVAPGPLYGVLTGQVSTGVPGKPDLSTIVGAEELGTVRVAAGATSTNGAGVTITNTARQTGPRGQALWLRSKAEQDALTPYDTLRVYRADLGAPLEYYGGSWHYQGPTPMPAIAGAWTEPAGQFGTTPAPLTSVVVPDPGFPYRLSVNVTCEMGSAAAGSRWDLWVRVVGSASGNLDNNIPPVELTTYQRIDSPVINTVFTGACTLYVEARRGYGSANGNITAFNRRFSVFRHAA